MPINHKPCYARLRQQLKLTVVTSVFLVMLSLINQLYAFSLVPISTGTQDMAKLHDYNLMRANALIKEYINDENTTNLKGQTTNNFYHFYSPTGESDITEDDVDFLYSGYNFDVTKFISRSWLYLSLTSYPVPQFAAAIIYPCNATLISDGLLGTYTSDNTTMYTLNIQINLANGQLTVGGRPGNNLPSLCVKGYYDTNAIYYARNYKQIITDHSGLHHIIYNRSATDDCTLEAADTYSPDQNSALMGGVTPQLQTLGNDLSIYGKYLNGLFDLGLYHNTCSYNESSHIITASITLPYSANYVAISMLREDNMSQTLNDMQVSANVSFPMQWDRGHATYIYEDSRGNVLDSGGTDNYYDQDTPLNATYQHTITWGDVAKRTLQGGHALIFWFKLNDIANGLSADPNLNSKNIPYDPILSNTHILSFMPVKCQLSRAIVPPNIHANVSFGNLVPFSSLGFLGVNLRSSALDWYHIKNNIANSGAIALIDSNASPTNNDWIGTYDVEGQCTIDLL
ncbi:hypothetical protein [Cysteiniphilum sp. 19S12-1]